MSTLLMIAARVASVFRRSGVPESWELFLAASDDPTANRCVSEL